MSAEKELRIALVCYGGVSLAVYMHGVTKELWKLLRASEALAAGREATGDSEPEWARLLLSLRPRADLRVLCDIVAGASAGGINGVLLAHAIAGGHDMEVLRTLWLENADVDVLLDPQAKAAGALSKVYAYPIAWWAGRSATLAAVPDPAARAEMAGKLSRFVRGRWFQPPFSGDRMTMLLDDALRAMEAAPPGPPLLPPTHPIDLFVTVTDWHGTPQQLRLHSPAQISETEHRRLISFRSGPALGTDRCDRALGDRPALAFAARATSSFPGAFPAASIAEVDRLLARAGEAWPGRDAFLAGALAGDRPPEDVRLIDGSVLNNAPFQPAIGALKDRRSHRDVERRFVYIDPQPRSAGAPPSGPSPAREPGFFATILRALADIPRAQPIRDNLEAINALSARVRRVRAVIDGMTPAVDAAILRAVGGRFFLLPLTPARLSRARGAIQAVAAREAGFAYAGYAQLKLRVVLDEAAAMLGGDPATPRAAAVRRLLHQTAEARGAKRVDTGAASPFVALLRGLDVGFRIRRLRFAIRRLVALGQGAPPAERAQLAAARGRLHAALAPFLAMRGDVAPRAAQAAARGDGAAGLDALAARLALTEADAQVDRALLETANALPRAHRQALVRAWLGFPFYDIALLPLMQEDGVDSLDEIRVDRISPDDAVALRAGDARTTLKGWQLNNFGAFFCRAYRENDYLWGRLHAAERLADIVATAAGAEACDPALRAALLRAILRAERPHLPRVAALIDELEGELG